MSTAVPPEAVQAAAGYATAHGIVEVTAGSVEVLLAAGAPSIRADERKRLRAEPVSITVQDAAVAHLGDAECNTFREKLQAASATWQRQYTILRPSSWEEQDFLTASADVWREIDRLEAEPEGYHPTRMSVELRERERAAWEAYRAVLDGRQPSLPDEGLVHVSPAVACQPHARHSRHDCPAMLTPARTAVLPQRGHA